MSVHCMTHCMKAQSLAHSENPQQVFRIEINIANLFERFLRVRKCQSVRKLVCVAHLLLNMILRIRCYYYLISRWGNWDTGRLNKLLKVTQWTGCKARDFSTSSDFRALFTEIWPFCVDEEMNESLHDRVSRLALLMHTWKSGSPMYSPNICYMLDTEDTAVAFKKLKKK